MTYKIIATGSGGNAVVIDGNLLIDCGVPYKRLIPYINDIKIIALTHIHSDHFNRATIKKIAYEHPNIRFICGSWLLETLLEECKVSPLNIDIYFAQSNIKFVYSEQLLIKPFELFHDVKNIGYKMLVNGKKVFYATDTAHLDGINAKEYDLYFIEANYKEQELYERKLEKELNDEYSYEYRVERSHLSHEQAEKFLIDNAGDNSEFLYIHQHKDNFTE